MSMKRLARACLTGAALCLAVAPAAAHPPDLPVDTRDECIPQLDTHVQPAGAPAASDPARMEHARRMYLIAERCRRAGDLEMARNCYQETRLLCPDSAYAHKAAQRIRRMSVRTAVPSEGDSEEQEPAEAPPEGRASLLREADYGKMVEAKVLFYVGERCRRGGDLDMAYRCYEEAHRACPQCRHGKKALQRMRRIDEDRQTNARAGEGQEPPLAPRVNEVRIEPVFPMIDPQIVPAFDRLLAQEGQIAGAALDLVEETSRPAPAGAEEAEEDYLPGPCGDTCPDSEMLRLFIEPPPRDLVLCPVHGEEAQDSAACEDLSDWLRQAVRTMGGAGSLRIDAARLGRLMAQGEGAVRALGCTVVHECGRAYVVYPARSR